MSIYDKYCSKFAVLGRIAIACIFCFGSAAFAQESYTDEIPCLDSSASHSQKPPINMNFEIDYIAPVTGSVGWTIHIFVVWDPVPNVIHPYYSVLVNGGAAPLYTNANITRQQIASCQGCSMPEGIVWAESVVENSIPTIVSAFTNEGSFNESCNAVPAAATSVVCGTASIDFNSYDLSYENNGIFHLAIPTKATAPNNEPVLSATDKVFIVEKVETLLGGLFKVVDKSTATGNIEAIVSGGSSASGERVYGDEGKRDGSALVFEQTLREDFRNPLANPSGTWTSSQHRNALSESIAHEIAHKILRGRSLFDNFFGSGHDTNPNSIMSRGSLVPLLTRAQGIRTFLQADIDAMQSICEHDEYQSRMFASGNTQNERFLWFISHKDSVNPTDMLINVGSHASVSVNSSDDRLLEMSAYVNTGPIDTEFGYISADGTFIAQADINNNSASTAAAIGMSQSTGVDWAVRTNNFVYSLSDGSGNFSLSEADAFNSLIYSHADLQFSTASGTVDVVMDVQSDDQNGGFAVPNSECADGVDNDGDGQIDYPSDTGCSTIYDPREIALAADESVIVEISIPEDSNVTAGYPVVDDVWRVGFFGGSFDSSVGVGNLVREPVTIEKFGMHDSIYIAPNVPDPERAVITFKFDRPVKVDQLEIAQHANGVTEVEGYVGDSVDSLASIGRIFGPLGDVTGSSIFSEGESYLFDFNNDKSGVIFQFIVRKTSLSSGYALYRAFPRAKDGNRYLPGVLSECNDIADNNSNGASDFPQELGCVADNDDSEDSPANDSDNDGIDDAFDNCLASLNSAQRDTNGDGFGNRCDPDLNDDNFTNSLDLGLFKNVFFTTDLNADLNTDGIVNSLDLGLLKNGFFQSPGPSAKAP